MLFNNLITVPNIVKTKLKIEGISDPITDFFSVNIQETLHGHHSFNLSLPMQVIEQSNQTLTKSHEFIGKNFHIEISPKTSEEILFKYDGIITSVNFSMSAPHLSSLNLSGMSPTVLIDDHEITKSFTDKKLDDIVKEVIGPYAIQSQTTASSVFSEKIPYCVQYRETPYQFLRRLAATYGEWFYYNGENIFFGELKPGPKHKLILGDDLQSYGFDMTATPLKDKSTVMDYLKEEVYDSQSQHDKVKNQDKFTTKLVSISEELFTEEGNDIYSPKYTSIKQVEKQQELFKAGLISSMQTLNGHSTFYDLHIGSCVDIVGTKMESAGSVSKAKEFPVGQFVITSISHSITREGDYNNHFTAIPDECLVPPIDSGAYSPKALKQSAEVVDNKDTDNIGRIQVRFPWMDSSEKTPWIRTMSPHAHKERGMYFIPEIGDRVLVDFENSDPDCPIVLGSLYHGEAKPSKWYNGNNDLKAIMTKSGNEVLFNDESGKETIQIFNKDQENMITMTLEGSKKIRIESTGYIEIQADKDITMKANNIKMSANNLIEMKCNDFEGAMGNNMTVDVGSNYELNAGMDMAISAGMNYELAAGMNAELNASMEYKCSGGMAAEMTALNTKVEGSAMLELKAGAMANLTGAMVKIN